MTDSELERLQKACVKEHDIPAMIVELVIRLDRIAEALERLQGMVYESTSADNAIRVPATVQSRDK